ncbi:MAG: DUF1841 family protein [Sulfuricaulis sp.]|nr:DUF1841 family protein [Sulfuricaulis sp.]
MFVGQDREQTREVFFRAWRAHREGRPLEGVEKLIVPVLLRHPEYHPILDNPETARGRDSFSASGETNPFLHLGMHIAIEEQLSLDQPHGMRDCYRTLLKKMPDEHVVQHQIMECLGEMIWHSQRTQTPPEERQYMGCLARLAGKPGLTA